MTHRARLLPPRKFSEEGRIGRSSNVSSAKPSGGPPMDVTFRVGDKAVYPAHGVAEITGIEKREISGSTHTFYILKIIENNMRIMVPMKNAGAVGLRAIIDKD